MTGEGRAERTVVEEVRWRACCPTRGSTGLRPCRRATGCSGAASHPGGQGRGGRKGGRCRRAGEQQQEQGERERWGLFIYLGGGGYYLHGDEPEVKRSGCGAWDVRQRQAGRNIQGKGGDGRDEQRHRRRGRDG